LRVEPAGKPDVVDITYIPPVPLKKVNP